MDPIVLNVADVVKAALSKWDQLGAVTGKTYCEYRYEDGTCCVIGAALTDGQALFLDMKGGSLKYASELGYVQSDNLDDLIRLQVCHDDICQPILPSPPHGKDALRLLLVELGEKYGVEV